MSVVASASPDDATTQMVERLHRDIDAEVRTRRNGNYHGDVGFVLKFTGGQIVTIEHSSRKVVKPQDL